jgi:hypothetical protein
MYNASKEYKYLVQDAFGSSYVATLVVDVIKDLDNKVQTLQACWFLQMFVDSVPQCVPCVCLSPWYPVLRLLIHADDPMRLQPCCSGHKDRNPRLSEQRVLYVCASVDCRAYIVMQCNACHDHWGAGAEDYLPLHSNSWA